MPVQSTEVRDLEQSIIVLESFEDLAKRPNFTQSLAFRPKSDRGFDAVVMPYHFLDSIPCGIESCHTPHRRGYLITTTDGLETGIGGHCGRKHFGISFTLERQRIDKALSRQRRIDSIMRAREDIPSLILAASSLKQAHTELSELKRRFMGAVGTPFYTQLKQRADRGQDRIIRDEPMTADEAAAYWETTNKKSRKDLPTKEVLVTTLSGLTFLAANFKDMLVTNLVLPLEQFATQSIDDIERMSPRVLQSTAKWVGRVPQDLIKAQEVVDAGRAFFTVENMLKLVNLNADMQALGPLIQELKSKPASPATRM